MEYQKGKARDQLTLYTTCLDDMVPGMEGAAADFELMALTTT